MQGMGSLRLGSRAVMYTAETLPKGKNRVMGVSQGGLGGALREGGELAPLENPPPPPPTPSRGVSAPPADAVAPGWLGDQGTPIPRVVVAGEVGG